jgi:hypothetical protein
MRDRAGEREMLLGHDQRRARMERLHSDRPVRLERERCDEAGLQQIT